MAQEVSVDKSLAIWIYEIWKLCRRFPLGYPYSYLHIIYKIYFQKVYQIYSIGNYAVTVKHIEDNLIYYDLW